MRLRDDVVRWREIDGEIVAVDVASSTYLAANETGALLWQMLAEGATRSALAQRLTERFGIPLERAEADVDAFVATLEQRGLLAE